MLFNPSDTHAAASLKTGFLAALSHAGHRRAHVHRTQRLCTFSLSVQKAAVKWDVKANCSETTCWGQAQLKLRLRHDGKLCERFWDTHTLVSTENRRFPSDVLCNPLKDSNRHFYLVNHIYTVKMLMSVGPI